MVFEEEKQSFLNRQFSEAHKAIPNESDNEFGLILLKHL